MNKFKLFTGGASSLIIISLIVFGIIISNQLSFISTNEFEDKYKGELNDEKYDGKIVKIQGKITFEGKEGSGLAYYLREYEIDGNGGHSHNDKDVWVESKRDVGDKGDYVQLKLRYHYEITGDAITSYWEVIEVREVTNSYLDFILPTILLLIGIILIVFIRKKLKVEEKKITKK